VRLFVAVWPPTEVLDLVGGLARPDVPGLRWTTPDQWHVTLRFLGDVESPAPVIDALRAAGAPAAHADLGPEVRRLGSHVLMVPVAGLDDVAAAVTAATAGIGTPPEDRPFRGHLTLARVRGRARVDLRSLAGAALGARWPVSRIALVQSALDPKGARYETIAEVELEGDPGEGARAG
jgi:2'-5' RNA ligase